MAISISGVFGSGVNPGPKNPPRWSMVSVSLVPVLPRIAIESVFAVVAPPHDTGACPKTRSPPGTRRVADPPGSIVYYRVTDIEAAHAELVRREVEFLQPPHRIAELGDVEIWMAFFEDTEGNTLAITSEKPVSR